MYHSIHFVLHYLYPKQSYVYPNKTGECIWLYKLLFVHLPGFPSTCSNFVLAMTGIIPVLHTIPVHHRMPCFRSLIVKVAVYIQQSKIEVPGGCSKLGRSVDMTSSGKNVLKASFSSYMFNFALVTWIWMILIVTMLWLIQVDLGIWSCIQQLSLYLVHKVKVWRTDPDTEGIKAAFEYEYITLAKQRAWIIRFKNSIFTYFCQVWLWWLDAYVKCPQD